MHLSLVRWRIPSFTGVSRDASVSVADLGDDPLPVLLCRRQRERFGARSCGPGQRRWSRHGRPCWAGG